MAKRSFFLVLEGCDGVGKGTVKRGIEQHLRRMLSLYASTMGMRLLVLRQPTNEARDEINQTDPNNWLRMLYLFMKDREAQYFRVLKSVLEQRNVVLMDRYYHSSCVYQGMAASLSPVDILKAHGPWVIKPDLTLILQVEPDELERRLAERGETMEKLEGDRGVRVEIQRRYTDLVRREYPEFDECVLIEASGHPNKVLEACLKKINVSFHKWESKEVA